MLQVTQISSASAPGSLVYHLKGGSHGNFVDAALWAPLWVMQTLGALGIPAAGPLDPTEAHVELAQSALQFIEQLDDDTEQTSSTNRPLASANLIRI